MYLQHHKLISIVYIYLLQDIHFICVVLIYEIQTTLAQRDKRGLHKYRIPKWQPITIVIACDYSIRCCTSTVHIPSIMNTSYLIKLYRDHPNYPIHPNNPTNTQTQHPKDQHCNPKSHQLPNIIANQYLKNSTSQRDIATQHRNPTSHHPNPAS